MTTNQTIRLILASLVLIHSLSVVNAKDFLIFDGTLYKNKPEFTQYGILPVNIIYQVRFWENKESIEQVPDITRIQQIAKKAHESGDIVVLDIEHWELKGDPDRTRESIQKYKYVIDHFRNYAPDLKIGYYGLPPIRDYYRALRGKDSPKYQQWQQENNRLVTLFQSIDISFPSLYTFKNNPADWQHYAIEQIKEARRIAPDKPVYVFLWPKFHNSNRLLKKQFIPEDFWMLQLKTARAYADGIVIWGGWSDGGPAEWNSQAPWWIKTLEFIDRSNYSTISFRQPK